MLIKFLNQDEYEENEIILSIRGFIGCVWLFFSIIFFIVILLELQDESFERRGEVEGKEKEIRKEGKRKGKIDRKEGVIEGRREG